ncbi:MAG: DUF2306 domain-containing protein [Myxococcaceae bacterium]|nr:DUF2306 domain-containing protein [Myxococcaceae bacterium]
MRRLVSDLPRLAFIAAMLAGSALITATSLASLDDENLSAFVMEKLPVRFEAAWFLALKVHLVAAAFSLPACVLLLTKALQRRLTVHRWLGRVTGGVVLLALVPSGAVLSLEATGGLPSTLGFLVSGGLIAFFMTRGILAARRHHVQAHRRATWHVLAQMSVAVSSRVLLIAFEAAGLEHEPAYIAALWGPVVCSALAVEVLSRWTLTERTPREVRPAVTRPALAVAFARAGR